MVLMGSLDMSSPLTPPLTSCPSVGGCSGGLLPVPSQVVVHLVVLFDCHIKSFPPSTAASGGVSGFASPDMSFMVLLVSCMDGPCVQT